MAVQESGKAEALGLKNVGGVFVVLISGLGVAFLIAVVEYYFERYRRNKRLRYSIVSFRFIIYGRGNIEFFCMHCTATHNLCNLTIRPKRVGSYISQALYKNLLFQTKPD